MDNQRNLLLAVGLCLLLLIGWDYGVKQFYPQPASLEQAERIDAPTRRVAAGTGDDTPGAPDAEPAGKRTREGGLTDPDQIAAEQQELRVDLASPLRVRIDAQDLAGSINPVGGLVDDIVLKNHRQTVDEDSGPIRLFSPRGTPAVQYAQFGWTARDGIPVPDTGTRWQVVQGGPLTRTNPVQLAWNNGRGLLFGLRFTVDDTYMITVDQTVRNSGAAPAVLTPFALVSRTSGTASQDTWTIHSGPIGNFAGSVDFGTNYDDVDEAGSIAPAGVTEWVGFTDIYWLSALIPQEGAGAGGTYRALGGTNYRADAIYPAATLAPGTQMARRTLLFAGAKESQVLDIYEDAGVGNFGLAIDWGWFRWFEKPIFWLLRQLFGLTHNFGVAIILLTCVIRAAIFPVAQRGFKSMAAMKAIQPKMKAIQARNKDDKQKQQQEIMALYKQEGVNPVAGCLPMLLQVPVFFALYKTLILTIEMRHQPFALWIKDLSAPDPATVLNLFGLLPFTPPSFLAIGVLALLLGASMYFQFKLNPVQDPVQAQMFAIMPWVLMFVMAPFAAGLLLYYITSNVLTIAQQKYLYSKHPGLRAVNDATHGEANTAIKAKG